MKFIPALSQRERIELLTGFRKMAPPPFFRNAMVVIGLELQRRV